MREIRWGYYFRHNNYRVSETFLAVSRCLSAVVGQLVIHLSRGFMK